MRVLQRGTRSPRGDPATRRADRGRGGASGRNPAVARRRAAGYRAAMSTELVRQVAGVSLATQRHYIIKRKFWSFFERVFRVWTGDGQLIMYIQHPLLRLREEFMVYEDEAQTRPLLRVKSRQVIAINFEYEITEASSGRVLGVVRKQGLSSLVRDRFTLLDAAGAEIGYAEE